MRVLVTGAEGFTGRYVLDALHRAGHAILPFDADITDQEATYAAVAVARPDGVIHLAGSAFIHSNNFAGFYLINQVGTFHLLASLAEIVPGIPVLLASSATVYGANASGYLTEDTPCLPGNHYAVSKLAMEIGARLWDERLSLRVLRPFNYTGKDQDERYLIAKIVAHFRRRETVIELGNLEVARDFGDVRAVADAYVGLLGHSASGTFNICTGKVHSLRGVIAACEAITGHTIDVRVNPAFVRANDVSLLAGDPGRLRAMLPQWRAIPLQDTLEWMLAG